MTQADFGIALLITALVVTFSLFQLRRIRRERLKTARYKLFAVRDRLIRLVADGDINEDDPTFTFLYEEINALIPKAKPLSLRALVKAFKESRLITDTAFRTKCEEAMSHKNDNVKAATHAFFSTLVDILVMRSFAVRCSFMLAHSGIRTAFWCRSLLRRLTAIFFPTQSEASPHN